MSRSEDLACRAAHLVGLAGDFIDWSRLDDEEFRHLIELVDVTRPEMSDALFEALSRLLQGEGLLCNDATASEGAVSPTSDPLYGAAPAPAAKTGLSAGSLISHASLRLIRGGRR